MHTGLFGQCMLAIGDGAAAGILVNFDDVPLTIRESIFAHVQFLGRTGENESDDDGPVLCLRRSQFYDRFDRIHLANSIDCRRYSRLLSTIVSEVERPGSGLGSSVVSLQLRVCVDQLLNSQSCDDESPPARKASSNLAVVCRLIAACPRLRRLDVSGCRNEQCAVAGCIDGSDEPAFLSDIDQALSAAARAPLEELTVRSCRDGNFGTRFSALNSLQFLSLRNCTFSFQTWSLLLEPCRRTLLTLILKKSWLNCSTCSLPFDGVELSVLRTLIIETRCSVFKRHRLLSPESFRHVRRGLYCVFQECDGRGTSALSDCGLSQCVEVALETLCLGDPSFDQLARGHELFGQRLVQLEITSNFDLIEAEQLDVIVGKLQSIRVLIMRGHFPGMPQTIGGNRFLHRFLSEPGHGAKLRRLEIRWDLTAPTVRLVFVHCVNLEYLFLAPHQYSEAEMPDITDQDLMIWAANGAKPKQVYLNLGAKFTIKGVNHLLRNCRGDFQASFLDERGRFVTRNDKLLSDVEKLFYKG